MRRVRGPAHPGAPPCSRKIFSGRSGRTGPSVKSRAFSWTVSRVSPTALPPARSRRIDIPGFLASPLVLGVLPATLPTRDSALVVRLEHCGAHLSCPAPTRLPSQRSNGSGKRGSSPRCLGVALLQEDKGIPFWLVKDKPPRACCMGRDAGVVWCLPRE